MLFCIFIVTELQACQDRRLRVQFNEDEIQRLNKNIRKISNKLKQDLKQVEKDIRLYVNEELHEAENDLLFQIKDNMSQNILTELNSFSKKFKLNRELYSQKCKEFKDEDDYTVELYDLSTNNSDLNENINNNDVDQNNFLMTEEPDQILQKRDNELNEIVRGVNNLQELFKDLRVIVIEQGTILDRIDYNIDVGYNNVSKGKKSLEKANESHKSSCFRNVILFLLICIFVESLLIVFKLL